MTGGAVEGRVGRWLIGGGLAAFGALSLLGRDFIATWTPVPKGVPAREALALIDGALLVLLGAAVAAGLRLRWTAPALAGLLALWVAALHLPRVAAHPAVGALWLGVAEVGAVALALATLATADRRAERAEVVGFGLCALVFGASHFLYLGFTAAMVPAWLPPGGRFWAALTGAAHVAAGLALLSGVLAGTAARALAAMFAAFILLVHLPRVAASGGDPKEWALLSMATALLGAALVLAGPADRATATRFAPGKKAQGAARGVV